MNSLASLRSYESLSENKPHGTRIKYKGGCRCLKCRAANSRYECERSAARKRGESNGIISAEKASKHLRKLSAKGIGRDTVADITGICASTIDKIRRGERKGIREMNEKKILNVSADVKSNGHFVSAKDTRIRVKWLLSEGFTYRTLSERLGYKSWASVFGMTKNKLVTAKNELKIKKFYDEIRLGE